MGLNKMGKIGEIYDKKIERSGKIQEKILEKLQEYDGDLTIRIDDYDIKITGNENKAKYEIFYNEKVSSEKGESIQARKYMENENEILENYEEVVFKIVNNYGDIFNFSDFENAQYVEGSKEIS